MSFEDWLKAGIDGGWCGPPVCHTHDGLPTSAAEDDQFEDGGEPCQHIIRLYPDAAAKAAIEANHSPSVWRRTNAGL